MSEKNVALFGFMLFAIFVFISSFVSAIDDTDLVAYYSFENDATDDTGVNNLTATNANYGTGYNGQGVDVSTLTAQDNYFNSTGVSTTINDGDFTLCFWFNTSYTASANRHIASMNDGVTGNWYLAQFAPPDGDAQEMVSRVSASGVDRAATVSQIDDGSWHFLCNGISDSKDDNIIYLDGSITQNNTADGDIVYDEQFVLGNYKIAGGSAADFIGEYDEVSVWNRTLSKADMDALYNSGTGYFYSDIAGSGGGGVPPSITLSTNLTSNINSTAYPFFFSIDAIGNVVNTTDLWNISVYLNGTLNQTHLNIALNVTKFVINLTYGIDETAYDVNVSVSHGYDTATDSFVKTNIFLDTVEPTIALLQPTTNNSIRYKGVDTIFNVSIFCADPNLFSCNLTFYNLTAAGALDTVINSSIVQSITTGNQTVTITNNVAKLEINRYAIIAEAADSHTNIFIPDYNWEAYQVTYNSKTYKGISFANNYLNLSTDDYTLVDDFALIKRSDRYLFGFNFNTINQPITLYLDSKKPMFYLPYSDYQGHFIIGTHWVDFVSDDVTDLSIDYLANAGVWRVRFTPIKNIVVFNSIGDLNIVKNIYYMNISENNFAFNMFIKDEDNPTTALVGSAEVEFNYYIGGNATNVTNYYADLSGSDNYAFNISTNASTIRGDLYIKYTTENGFTHRYIVVNTTFNTTQGYNFTLYNFNTTTGISDLKITARQNANYKYYPDVIAKLQRRYTSEGLWRTVQMDQSGDFGVLFFNVREETTDYRIIFTDLDNNILKTTESLKFVCTDGFCDLTTLLDPYAAVAASADITASFIYDNATGLLNFTWEDADAGSNTVRMRSRQDTVTGAIYPCDQTQSAAASGSYSCNVTGRQGSMEVTVIANGVIILNEWIELNVGKIGAQIDEREGAFWSALIMVVCVTFGLFSPAGAIITMVIGLVVIYLLGIFTPLTMTFTIIAAVIGILIGFKVRQ